MLARETVPPSETRFLNPGEWAVGGAGEVFGTLLGSCVALVLWHPAMRLGAICHYVLPRSEGRAQAAGPDARYGCDAFDFMTRALANRGAALSQCVAKLFGGARVYEQRGDHAPDIGARNIACGRAWLATSGLPAAAESVGGFGWRRLCFDAGSGEVWTRFNTQRLATLPAQA